MYKANTPFGCLELPDERMADNAMSMYKELTQHKKLDVRTVAPIKVKSGYTEKTMFGVAHTPNYSTAARIRMINKLDEPKKLDIKTAH